MLAAVSEFMLNHFGEQNTLFLTLISSFLCKIQLAKKALFPFVLVEIRAEPDQSIYICTRVHIWLWEQPGMGLREARVSSPLWVAAGSVQEPEIKG